MKISEAVPEPMTLTPEERERLKEALMMLNEIQQGDVIGVADCRRLGSVLAFVRQQLAETEGADR